VNSVAEAAESAGGGSGDHTHDHDHPHPHPVPHIHAHPHRVAVGPGEVRPAGPTQGVVVDIGDGIGALVLYADADREWMEPEIQPIEDPSARQHVWVLARIVGSGIVYAAVFPSLPEGRYGLCAPGGVTTQEIEIVGGAVTEERWL